MLQARPSFRSLLLKGANTDAGVETIAQPLPPQPREQQSSRRRSVLCGAGASALLPQPLGVREVTDAGLSQSRGALSHYLDLDGCEQVTDAGVSYVAQLALLPDLSWCKKVTDDGVQALAQLPLSSLNLSYCNQVTDAGVSSVAQLRPPPSTSRGATKSLTPGCPLWPSPASSLDSRCWRVTDAGLSSVARVPQLSYPTSLSHQVTDAGCLCGLGVRLPQPSLVRASH